MVTAMNGFIEVTDSQDGFKLLLSVSQIKSVIEMDDGSTCIEMIETRKGFDDIVHCLEWYKDVVKFLEVLKSSK